MIQVGMTLKQGGVRHGEYSLNVTDAQTNKYFGGAPLCIDANGVRLCKAADRSNFIGVAAVSSYEDLKNGNLTVISGHGSILKFTDGSASQDNTDPVGNVVEGAPWDTTKVFVAGQKVYIDANGKYTNVVDAGKAVGTVTKGQSVNDNSLEIELAPVTLD